MRILGLSISGPDSAAALIQDGRIVAAAQEERFSRHKHDGGFPQSALRYCLDTARVPLNRVDMVAFHDSAPPLPTVTVAWKRFVEEHGTPGQVVHIPHALAHAASAFFPSPFTDAAILTMDDGRDQIASCWAAGHGNTLQFLQQTASPHSLARLYSILTEYLGFRVNSGEYKVMGLAPYGEPRYVKSLRDNLIDIHVEGAIQLNPAYFGVPADGDLARDKLAALFGQPARKPETDPLHQFHLDMAASIQQLTEEAMLAQAQALYARTKANALCLGGDIALNCVANGRILREGMFHSLWIQPAAGQAGAALGAAFAAYHIEQRRPRRKTRTGKDLMQGSLLGPTWSQADIENRLRAQGAVFDVLDDDALMERTAQSLVEEKAVGWMQGRMEFGPRALGARSILADPRSGRIRQMLNRNVKYRESFRPFAPSVLREDVTRWFELDADSPYMLLVAPVTGAHLHAPGTLPAVTHVDGSARIQTVDAQTNPRYHALISAFKDKTGIGVLVNTSFNVRGEPMVCSPEDAFRCFMGSDIEVLVAGNCFLEKKDQNPALALDYRNAFDLD